MRKGKWKGILVIVIVLVIIVGIIDLCSGPSKNDTTTNTTTAASTSNDIQKPTIELIDVFFRYPEYASLEEFWSYCGNNHLYRSRYSYKRFDDEVISLTASRSPATDSINMGDSRLSLYESGTVNVQFLILNHESVFYILRLHDEESLLITRDPDTGIYCAEYNDWEDNYYSLEEAINALKGMVGYEK